MLAGIMVACMSMIACSMSENDLQQGIDSQQVVSLGTHFLAGDFLDNRTILSFESNNISISERRVTLRNLTNATVSYAIWLLENKTIQTVTMTDAVFNATNYTGVSPAAGASFIGGVGGVQKINTTSGFPSVGDAWFLTRENKTQLVIATEEGLDYTYFYASAKPPVQGVSQLNGFSIESKNHRVYLNISDPQKLPLIVINNTITLKINNTHIMIPSSEIGTKHNDINTTVLNHRSSSFDAVGGFASDAAATLSWDHTIVGTDNTYLSSIGIDKFGGEITSVTYEGGATTKLFDQNNGGDDYLYYAYKTGLTGTQTIVYTDTNAGSSWAAVSYSAIGVNQTAPHSNYTSLQATNTTPVITIPSATDELVITAQSTVAFTATLTTDPTWNISNQENPGSDIRMSGGFKNGSATVKRNDTLSASQVWAMGGASLRAAPTDSTSTPLWWFNQTNSTLAGSNITHSVYWNVSNSSVGNLSGYIFYLCNATYTEVVTSATVQRNATNWTGNWTTPQNANFADNINATGGGGNRQNFTNFGFGIPAGATIIGINITVKAGASSATGTNAFLIQVWNGSRWSAVNNSGDIAIPTRIFNFSNKLWGLNWTNTTANNLTINITSAATSTRLMRLDSVNVSIVYSFVNTSNCNTSTPVYTAYPFVPMTNSANWSNYSIVVTSNVNSTIRWYIWANTTTQNTNTTSVFTYNTTSAGITPAILDTISTNLQLMSTALLQLNTNTVISLTK